MKNNIERIHIMGSIGSGKTTLAKELSFKMGISHYELDNVAWIRNQSGDIKRTVKERDRYLETITEQQYWIMEGAHHKWVTPCLERADLIIYLDVNIRLRKYRIIKRFIKQKMAFEKANYKPTFKILKDLYRYNTVFEEKVKHEIFTMLAGYEEKLIVVTSKNEITNHFKDRLLF